MMINKIIKNKSKKYYYFLYCVKKNLNPTYRYKYLDFTKTNNVFNFLNKPVIFRNDSILCICNQYFRKIHFRLHFLKLFTEKIEIFSFTFFRKTTLGGGEPRKHSCLSTLFIINGTRSLII